VGIADFAGYGHSCGQLKPRLDTAGAQSEKRPRQATSSERILVSQSSNTIARRTGAVHEIPDYGDAQLTDVLRSDRNGHVYGQVLTNRVGCRPIAEVYRSSKVLNQRAMGPQLRQPRRDGGHNLMTRHVDRTSFVQAVSDPIDRCLWCCPQRPVMSPARPERLLHGDHCARSFINSDNT
jgi:hypothetical protein